MSDRAGPPQEVLEPFTFPPVPVPDLLGIISFLRESYGDLVAAAGARGYEPVLTMPPHLVDVRARLFEEIERQAREASEGGFAVVTISIEPTRETLHLLHWYMGRRRVFETLPAKELPPAWGSALALLNALLDGVLEQFPYGLL